MPIFDGKLNLLAICVARHLWSVENFKYFKTLSIFIVSFFPAVDDMSAQLNGVRMKLEQRRKRIEEEKRKMEQVMERQREKVGHQAFLRAVVKPTNSIQGVL